ncbi:MAG: single-stranded DNA-binding protein [Limosilactobacillus gorillae]|jgi:single-strand DNA-binding protein|nr:single-stranded DNA-binding protein [Limosilactobacillus gorillae]
MLNRVVLTGRLTRDPELTYTQSGTPVLRFSIAVDRQFKNRETGRRDADFINCVIWRTSAENFARFTHKGALVGLDGRLSTSNYENQQGQRVYRTEVTVENFALLEPRSANNGNGGYNGGSYNNGNGGGFNNQGQAFGNNAYGNGGNFGAAPQNNFGGSSAPVNQPYGGNFNQNQGGVFNQGPTQIDADSLPFSQEADSNSTTSSSAVNIDDNAALNNGSAGSGSASSTQDQDGMPSSNDLPF